MESMRVNRRSLLVGGAATALAIGVGRADAAPSSAAKAASAGNLPAARIGVTPYSVQDQADAMGYAKLFPLLRSMGYRGIEFSGFKSTPAVTPAQVKRLLSDNDLKGIGNKGAMDDASIDLALAAGIPWTGISVLTAVYGDHTDAWKQTADDHNAFGEKCVKRGLKGFFVHMHGPEYAVVADDPQRRVIEVLLEHTDPRYVFWEMDLYWAYFFSSHLGGAGLMFDPVNYVIQNPKRFPFFHVKDGGAVRQDVAGQQASVYVAPNLLLPSTFPLSEGVCDVSQGHVPFRSFFGALSKVSALENHWFFWERDNAKAAPNGSLTSARASYLMMAHGKLADPAAK